METRQGGVPRAGGDDPPQTITGRFGTIYQMDAGSGESVFTVYPYRKIPGTRGGALKCRGLTPPYAEGDPVIVTGKPGRGAFEASECRIASDTEEGLASFFRSACGSLSEKRISGLVGAVKGVSGLRPEGLFEFFREGSAGDVIRRELDGLSEAEAEAERILAAGDTLLKNEGAFRALMPCGVPYACICGMAEDGTAPEEAFKEPYGVLMGHGAKASEADRFALLHCGFGKYSVTRLTAFVKEALDCAYEGGCSCVRYESLEALAEKKAGAAGKANGTGGIRYPAALLYLCLARLGPECRIREDDGVPYVYRARALEAETRAVNRTAMLLRDRKGTRIKPDMEAVENIVGVRYNEGQRQAFKALETTGIKVITGAPGTGKTMLVKGLAECYGSAKGRDGIRLAATTGKAAEVLTEACGLGGTSLAARTVHSLLGITGDSGFRVPTETLAGAGLVIVDETSMMGLELFSLLASAVRSDAVLILVGDADQLPSVEYGNVLSDLISCGKVETYRLTEAMRSDGGIRKAAADILLGKAAENGPAFRVTECAGDEEALAALRGLWGDAQVMSPVKGGPLGCDSLNRLYQKEKAGTAKNRGVTHDGRCFREGDRVMFTRNNYRLGYLNGDQGSISRIYGGGVCVDRENGAVVLGLPELCDITLSYAVTVHKSQGSEYGRVVLVLPEGCGSICTRRLLYTAVTRAKERVDVISVNNAYARCLKGGNGPERVSLMAKRIQEASDGGARA